MDTSALAVKCVEVALHEATIDATVETAMELDLRLDKALVLINREVPDFIANRLMGAIQHEALFLVIRALQASKTLTPLRAPRRTRRKTLRSVDCA